MNYSLAFSNLPASIFFLFKFFINILIVQYDWLHNDFTSLYFHLNVFNFCIKELFTYCQMTFFLKKKTLIKWANHSRYLSENAISFIPLLAI